ncbi:hypothetical protein PCC7424_5499 (plasmid) [Gloeothece citriformis PCC 7424]|uniref:Siphovirus Gp157 family protein n=1 Tax=Gloeothece citriformis (strain PCC 7424) TaxID=65393 RepID=B7KMP6_GLOC7|nr:siphovirus Gp157 family protein [Gloeothece citriformis]ACK74068.1 hypothetical protein PCC7424_5499 [Gloeothece citriformis PCC 7424]
MATETLTKLDDELELLLTHLSSDNPEDRAIAEEIFNNDFLPRLEKKIDDYVKAIKYQEGLLNYRLSEIERIKKLAESSRNTITWLKCKLQAFMENRVLELGDKGKKLEGKLSKISLCTNGGKLPVWFNPELKEKDYPDQYLEYVPTLNKSALVDAVVNSQDGEIRDRTGRLVAKVMPRGEHLRIS